MISEGQVALAEARSQLWAMKFLGVFYREPLLHVLDPDLSGFVSVAETNKFTDAIPEGCRWGFFNGRSVLVVL